MPFVFEYVSNRLAAAKKSAANWRALLPSLGVLGFLCVVSCAAARGRGHDPGSACYSMDNRGRRHARHWSAIVLFFIALVIVGIGMGFEPAGPAPQAD